MATKYNVPTGLDGVINNVDAFDDLADTIANPPTSRPLKGAIGRSGQDYCDFYGSAPQAAKSLLGPGFAASGLLCKPYWDSAGYDAPVQAPPPFGGGQCSGTGYQATASFTVNVRGGGDSDLGDFSATVVVDSITYNGPISSATIELRGTGGTGGTTNLCQLIVTDAGGLRPPITLTSRGDPGRLTNLRPGSITFARVSGGPDICGDPPSEGFEPGANPPPTPTFPPGQEPGVDPDGQPFFFVPPIEGLPGEPVDVPPSEPGGGAGGGPTEPPVAGDEQEGGDGDEEFPPPEDGRRWVGCCIRLTAIPIGTGMVPGTSPEAILTQVVGNARLKFDSVSGDGYDTPVQIRSAGLCLWEPVKGLSPKGVRVNLKPGFEYAYTPYSVEETE